MSGGLDSTTLAAKALAEGYAVLPINIDYGQRNIIERLSFKKIQAYYKKNYPDKFLDYVNIDLTRVLETSLNTYKLLRDSKIIANKTQLEFYTPSRNLVFATLASMVGEIAAAAIGLEKIEVGIGVHQHTQYDRNYWDITPEFIKRLNFLLELNDNINISMYTPYVNETKDKIVLDALSLGVPIFDTWTCYSPLENGKYFKPCLECEACLERQAAGDKANLPLINNYAMHLDESW